MEFKNFEEILNKVKAFETPKRVVAVEAVEDHVLEAVFYAASQGIVYPVLIGDKGRIRAMLDSLGLGGRPCRIVSAPEGVHPTKHAIDMINAGEGDFLMKGLIGTADFLKPVVDKANGMNVGGVMSHFSMAQLPTYHKLIVATDAAVVIDQTAEAKEKIIGNAVRTMHALGYERPKLALISAVEKVNPKLQDTVDADILVRKWERGEITGCDLAGPMSYDLAISAESARIKEFPCEWCGNFDVVVVPGISAGNILIKCWVESAGGDMAGIIVGARVPIVLASRSTNTTGKYLSLALAAACC